MNTLIKYWEWLRHYDELLLVIPLTIFAKVTWRLYSFRDFSSEDIGHLYDLKAFKAEIDAKSLSLAAKWKEFDETVLRWQEELADYKRRTKIAEDKAEKRGKELAGARARFRRKLGGRNK